MSSSAYAELCWNPLELFCLFEAEEILPIEPPIEQPVPKHVGKLAPSVEYQDSIIHVYLPNLYCNFTTPEITNELSVVKLAEPQLILKNSKDALTFDMDLSKQILDLKTDDSLKYNIECNREVTILDDRILFEDWAIMLDDIQLDANVVKIDSTKAEVRLKPDNKKVTWENWSKIIDPTVVTTNMTIYLPLNETYGWTGYDYFGEVYKGSTRWDNLTFDNSVPVGFSNYTGRWGLAMNGTGSCCGMPVIGNSANSSLPFPNSSMLGNAGYTFCSVIQPRSIGLDAQTILRIQIGSQTIFFISVDGNLSIQVKGDAGNTGVGLKNNSVVHTCWTYNLGGTQVKLYVNSTLVNTFSGGSADAPDYGNIFIGHQDFDADVFNGSIDHVRIWNGYALSQAEVTNVYYQDLQREIDFTTVSNQSTTNVYKAEDGTFSKSQVNYSTLAVERMTGNTNATYVSPIFNLGNNKQLINASWNVNNYYNTEIFGVAGDGISPPIEQDYNRSINTTGLVILYHCNNDSSEDNTIVRDFSGNGNNGKPVSGSVVNRTQYQLGSGSCNFNGKENQFINITNSSTIGSINSAYTISMWTYLRGNSHINYAPIFFSSNNNDKWSNDSIEVYQTSGVQGLTIAHNRNNGGTFGFGASGSAGACAATNWGNLTPNKKELLTITLAVW